MDLRRAVVEALSGLHRVDLLPEVHPDLSVHDIAELLTGVRLILLECLMRGECNQQGFHLELLRGRHQPFTTVALLVHLLEAVRTCKDDLLLRRCLEKLTRRRAEALDEIHQRHHRRRHLPSLQLRNKALRQLRPVRQLLLRETVPVPEILDFPPDFDVHLLCCHERSLSSVYTKLFAKLAICCH